jgi:hypothetical protein
MSDIREAMARHDETPESIVDAESGEVITDVSEGGKRKIRVYDPKGDFVIEVPDGAKVTFGYFNPAAQRNEGGGRDAWGSPQNVARQTALRIYERGEKGNQLACFIGVTGFRDLGITITRLRQHVVVETNYEDDGEAVQWGGKRQQRLIAQPEELDF